MTFSKQIKKYAKRIKNVLRNFLNQQPFQNTSLFQAMKYGVLLRGKRLRPFLVYATGNMFGVDNTILDTPAAAIECMHAYSLLHDDLPSMDNDNLRRGLPTCHIKYGESNAMLAGNALQTLAFNILSKSPMNGVKDRHRLIMISELAMASGISGMCGGQTLDLESKGKQIKLKQLKRIYYYKTAALIRAAVLLGAISAGDHSQHVISSLYHYADCIGLAFQIQDDILDVENDISVLSNNLSKNKKQIKKNTYPALLGLKKARLKAQNLIDNAHQSLNYLSKQLFDISALETVANYVIQRNK